MLKIFNFFLFLTFIPVISFDVLSEDLCNYYGNNSLGSSPGDLKNLSTPNVLLGDIYTQEQTEERLAAAVQRVQKIINGKVVSLREQNLDDDQNNYLKIKFSTSDGDKTNIAEPFTTLAEVYGTEISAETYNSMRKGHRRFYVPKDRVVFDSTNKEGLRKEDGDYVLAIFGCTKTGSPLNKSELDKHLREGKFVYTCLEPIAFTYIPPLDGYPKGYGQRSGGFKSVVAATLKGFPKKGFQVLDAKKVNWVNVPEDHLRGKPKRLKLEIQFSNTEEEDDDDASDITMVSRQVSVDPDILNDDDDDNTSVGGVIRDRVLTLEQAAIAAAKREMQSDLMSPQPGHPLVLFGGNGISTSPAKKMLKSNASSN